MSTREKAHKLLDELPDSALEPVYEFLVSRTSNGSEENGQTSEERMWALANAREAIREEPW